MLELIINEQNELKKIELFENGKLIEYYEEKEDTNRNEGNIYIGVIKDVLKGMQSAFVDIGTTKNSFIHKKDMIAKIDQKVEQEVDKRDIDLIAKKGQKVLVQVKKDSNETKGARVSTHISLTGKNIVLMPNTKIITVSQKIEKAEEQERLINIVKENISKENGAIIRTRAEGKEQEIIDEIKKLEEKWNDIVNKFNSNKENAPQLIYKSENIIEKMLIDLSDEKIDKIITNSLEEKNKIEKFINENMQNASIKIENRKTKEIEDIYDCQKQIEKRLNRKVWLNCGGFITIDKTEALTAIDVNTGKYTGNRSLENTVFRVNEEATIEIAKQLRLRDIGGIIIIDYIDMKHQDNKDKILNLLAKELKKDRTKTQIEGFTRLDLMEVTRKHICSHNN